MKKGKSLVELATEVERQRKEKEDYVAGTQVLTMAPHVDGTLAMRVPQGLHSKSFGVTDIAHMQIANRLGIPKKYYDRMAADNPTLLARNVNSWFRTEPEKRMVRTLDGDVRAFLSNRYRQLDNDEVCQVCLPVLNELEGVKVLSADITDRRLYIKFVTERLQGEVKEGDIVQAGGVISNSEVGQGTLRIDDLVYRLVCLNGMIRATVSRTTHVGRAAGLDGVEAQQFYKDDTRKADDKALLLKVRDTLKGMFTPERWQNNLEQLQAAATGQTIRRVSATVEVVSERYNLNEDTTDSVLTHLIKGGDLSQWGMANAITAASQDVEDYETATELEKLGGDVIQLPQRDWSELASVEGTAKS